MNDHLNYLYIKEYKNRPTSCRKYFNIYLTDDAIINDSKKDLIRFIPINPDLKSILNEKLQIQDIFSMLFQHEYRKCGINIYGFSNYSDKRKVNERLKILGFGEKIKQNIIDNLNIYPKQIDKNITYFVDPHFWSTYKVIVIKNICGIMRHLLIPFQGVK